MTIPHISVHDYDFKAHKRLRSAANVTLLIGIASMMIGVFSLTLDNRVFDPADAVNLPIGVMLVVMSFIIRRRSLPALWFTIGAYVLTAVLNLINIATTGSPGQYALATLVGRVIFLIPLIQGVGAINALKETEPQTSSPTVPQA
jgi:hypothetical protein